MGERVVVVVVVFVVTFCSLASFVCCEQDATSILEACKEVVETFDAEKNREMAVKHFLTTKKEDSFWYHMIKELKDKFKLEFSFDNLQFIEHLLHKVAAHYESCIKLNGVARSKCFSRLGKHSLKDLEHGLRWPEAADFDGVMDDRIKYGSLYMGAGLLVAHLAIVAEKEMSSLGNGVKTQSFKPFREALNILYYKPQRTELPFGAALVEWRIDLIGSAKICMMIEHFWKEFESTCENRWHSTEWVAEGDTTGDKRDTTGNKRVKIASGDGDDTTDDIEKDDFEGLEGAEDTGLDQVNELGGSNEFNYKKIRIQVFDSVERKVLYEKHVKAPTAERGGVMDKYAIEALKVRVDYVKKVKPNIEEYAHGLNTQSTIAKAINHFNTLIEP